MRVEITFAGDAHDAEAASAQVVEALKRLFTQGEQTGLVLREIKITAGQASETAANARRMQDSISGVGREARQARREVEALKLSGRSGVGVGPFGSGFGRVGLLGAAVGAGTLVSGPAGLAALGGLSALPGLLGAGGAAVGVLTGAFQGLGKAVEGDYAAFQKLDPVAQRFVQTLRSLEPFMDRLQETARGGLFPGLTAGLHDALTPANAAALEQAVAGISKALGDVGEQFGKSIGSPAFTRGFGELMQHSATWLREGGDAADHLAGALGKLTVAAIPLDDWLVKSVDHGARLVDGWVAQAQASGQLSHALDAMKGELQIVGRFGEALGKVVFDLARALTPLGNEVLVGVTHELQHVATWVENNRQGIVNFTTGALHGLEDVLHVIVPLLLRMAGGLVAIVHAMGGWETAFTVIISGALALQVAKVVGQVAALRSGILGLGAPEVLAALAALAGGFKLGQSLAGSNGPFPVKQPTSTVNGSQVTVSFPYGDARQNPITYDTSTGKFSEWNGKKDFNVGLKRAASDMGVTVKQLLGAIGGPTNPTANVASSLQGLARTSGSTPTSDAGRQKLVQLAMSMLGKPYLWGGHGPDGFDCSGLVMWAMGQEGVNIPHFTGSQYQLGTPVTRANAQAGDVVFTEFNKKGVPQHEGLYVGGGQVIEAPHTGDVVKKISLNAFVAGQQYAIRNIYDTAGASYAAPPGSDFKLPKGWPFGTPPPFTKHVPGPIAAGLIPSTVSGSYRMPFALATSSLFVPRSVSGEYQYPTPSRASMISTGAYANNLIGLLGSDPSRITAGPSVASATAHLADLRAKLGPEIKAIQKAMTSDFLTSSDLAAMRAQLDQYKRTITGAVDGVKAAVQQRMTGFQQTFQQLGQNAITALNNEAANWKSPSQQLIDQLTSVHDDQALQDNLQQAQQSLADALVGTPDNSAIVTNIKAILGRQNLATMVDQVQSGILGIPHTGINGDSLLAQLTAAVNGGAGVDQNAVDAASKQVAEAKYQIQIAGLAKQATAEDAAHTDELTATQNHITDLMNAWGSYFTSLHGNIGAIKDFWVTTLNSMGLPGVAAAVASATDATTAAAGGLPVINGVQWTAADEGAAQALSLAQVNALKSAYGPGGPVQLHARGGIAMRPIFTRGHIGGEAGREAMIPLDDPRGRAALRGAVGDVHVYIGGEKIDERVDTRIQQSNRKLGDRVSERTRSGRY